MNSWGLDCWCWRTKGKISGFVHQYQWLSDVLKPHTLPAHFAHACLLPLNSIKPPRRILNSTAAAAASWVLLTCPEDPRGFQPPHICRSTRTLPGHVDRGPSHSGASEQNSAARGNYRRPSGARWSAGRDNLQEEEGDEMETEEEQTSTAPPFLQLDSLHLAGGEQTDVIIDNPVGRAQRSTQGWKWFRRQLSTCQMSPQCCSALSVSEDFTAREGVDIDNIRKWHDKSGGVEAAGRRLDETLLQFSKWNSKLVVLTSEHTLIC